MFCPKWYSYTKKKIPRKNWKIKVAQTKFLNFRERKRKFIKIHEQHHTGNTKFASSIDPTLHRKNAINAILRAPARIIRKPTYRWNAAC